MDNNNNDLLYLRNFRLFELNPIELKVHILCLSALFHKHSMFVKKSTTSCRRAAALLHKHCRPAIPGPLHTGLNGRDLRF